MNILFTSAEAAPFAKVGGLADVVGSLPAALRHNGIDARVIIPGYGFINRQQHQVSHLFTFDFPHRNGTSTVEVYTTLVDDTPFYLIQSWPYFGDDATVYTVWDWDIPRFVFFNQAAMAVAWQLHERLGWFPDVFHVNDWHTGLIPFLIHESRANPIWGEMGTITTIHNIAYQGDNAGGWLFEAGVHGRHQPDLVYQDLSDNLLGIAIAYSDVITTVSPRYATEIQYPSMGYGLNGIISARGHDVHGILNGIDVDRWNPETDPYIASNYNADNFTTNRPPNKANLQDYASIDVRPDVPVIGIVSRLVWQKGFDLALPALRRLLLNTDVQVIALGSGDPELEDGFAKLEQDFRWRGVRSFLQYDAALAQHIYAGCDMFLMPSHFEPCGIGQMMAMRYGALPVVRETGGLADTVTNYDNADGDVGTGFTFLWEEPDAIEGTLRWAINTYRQQPKAWQRMQKRAMQTDFSWGKSAQEYTQLYTQVISKRKGYNP